MPYQRLFSLTLLLLLSQPSFAQTKSENDGFEIVRQDEKITMYERWTPYPGTTTDARQIKCVFHINSDLAKAYAYVYEDSKIQTWQDNILEYKIMPKNDSLWVAYSYYRIPWPLANQDYLLTYRVLEKNENKVILTFTHLEDEKLGAVRKGVDRRPTVGRWELENVAKGKVKITYTTRHDSLPTGSFTTA
jgi:hypothetical protein